MKKVVALLLCVSLALSAMIILGSCGGEKQPEEKTYEIAVVTDVGQLMDGGFNQGTYEGAKNYAEKNGKTYKYYQPANGSDATNDDRIAAMRLAVDNGAKVIVAPGFLQEVAITTVAKENPDVKFIFVDGWAMGIDNVTAVVYKEEESGYMAGYAAVKDGYRKLGATLGGGGSNPACNRYGYGFVQGAAAAAAELDVDIEIRYSYQYGDAFSASSELETQIAGWYNNGTEIVFSCGGSMFQSVKNAAEATTNGKIVGVDVDQSPLSERVVTSAIKGLSVSVEKILGEFYGGNWNTKLADKASNLGAADDATGIPAHFERFKTFAQADYDALFGGIKNGTITIDNVTPGDCNNAKWLTDAMAGNAHVEIVFE